MFTGNSYIVKVWFTAVLTGTYTYAEVPDLSNLREEVGKKLTQIGYDITEPEVVVEPQPEEPVVEEPVQP